MSSTLNGDMKRRAVVHTAALDWQQSPATGVWRKRLHLVGPEESGQVTSLVRFEAGSSFAEHGHPDGEEILVLRGTFSDEGGDWAPGSYLLNPDGSRHTPFTRTGCELFVKLQQYGGVRRCRLEVDTESREWLPTAEAGIEQKVLYSDRHFPDRTRLERWRAGAAPRARRWNGGVEIFVVEGELEDQDGRYEGGTWLRLPPGTSQQARSPSGCVLYVKEGAVAGLHSEPATTPARQGEPGGRAGT